MPQLKQSYIDTGKLYFEFRDYPLDYHPGSRVAASYANCAAQQGRFWQLHDRIVTGFADGEWAVGDRADEQLFARYAAEAQIDAAQLETCRAEREVFETALRGDMTQAEQYGIRGTPMFVLNGSVLYGAYSFSTWSQLLDARLAQSPPEPTEQAGPSRQLLFIIIGAGLFILAVAGGAGLLTYRLIRARER